MRTLVGVVLDRSGSMSTVLKDTIGGFNSFVEVQRSENHDQVYVITQFDSEYEVIQNGVDLDDVIVLNTKNFVPRGATALLDAMGRTIHAMDSVMANDKTIKQALMLILTDGGENASREFTRDQVFSLIEERRKLGNWDFNFLGANQDAIAIGGTLCIQPANCMQYAATPDGTTLAFDNITRSVSNYSVGESSAFVVPEEKWENPNS